MEKVLFAAAFFVAYTIQAVTGFAGNIFAMPVPMPLVEPVTMATLSFKRSMVSLFLRTMASQL